MGPQFSEIALNAWSNAESSKQNVGNSDFDQNFRTTTLRVRSARALQTVPGVVNLWVTVPSGGATAAKVGTNCLGSFMPNPVTNQQYKPTDSSDCNGDYYQYEQSLIYPVPTEDIGGAGTPCAPSSTCKTCTWKKKDERSDDERSDRYNATVQARIDAGMAASGTSLMSHYPQEVMMSIQRSFTNLESSFTNLEREREEGGNGRVSSVDIPDCANLVYSSTDDGEFSQWKSNVETECFGWDYLPTPRLCAPGATNSVGGLAISANDLDDMIYKAQEDNKNEVVSFSNILEANKWVDENLPTIVSSFNDFSLEKGKAPSIDLELQAMFAGNPGYDSCYLQCREYCSFGVKVSGPSVRNDRVCYDYDDEGTGSTYTIFDYIYIVANSITAAMNINTNRRGSGEEVVASEVRQEHFVLAGITTALLRAQAERGVAANSILSLSNKVTVAVGARTFPTEPASSRENDFPDFIGPVITILLPLASSFLIPVFVYLVVVEKELRLKAMMSMMGLRSKVYWITVYCFNFAMAATMAVRAASL